MYRRRYEQMMCHMYRNSKFIDTRNKNIAEGEGDVYWCSPNNAQIPSPRSLPIPQRRTHLCFMISDQGKRDTSAPNEPALRLIAESGVVQSEHFACSTGEELIINGTVCVFSTRSIEEKKGCCDPDPNRTIFSTTTVYKRGTVAKRAITVKAPIIIAISSQCRPINH